MKTKILFILHLPPPVHGAGMVGQLIRESRYINSCFEGYYINLSTSTSIDDIGKGGLKKAFRYSGIVWKTLYKAIVFRPDVVYITMAAKGGGFYKDAFVVLLLKLLRKKVVFHFHNKGIKDRHRKLDHFLYRWVFRNSRVILLSENLKEDVARYVDDKQLYYCPNGIAANPQNATIERSFSGIPKILFIGNLSESKGIYDLLDVLSGVHQLGVAFECNIVGDEGTMSKNALYRKIAELNLETLVNYRGRVVGEAKEWLLREADVFVHPSHEECFPLVLLEAMSAGLPVVSTIEGGIPDIVVHNETGFLVEKGNVKELKTCIIELLKNEPLRRKFGMKGRERFLERFTVEQFEQRFIEILNDVTGEIKRT